MTDEASVLLTDFHLQEMQELAAEVVHDNYECIREVWLEKAPVDETCGMKFIIMLVTQDEEDEDAYRLSIAKATHELMYQSPSESMRLIAESVPKVPKREYGHWVLVIFSDTHVVVWAEEVPTEKRVNAVGGEA